MTRPTDRAADHATGHATDPTGPRLLVPLLAVVLALLAGCATVPGSSDVSVLRRVGDPAEPTTAPGPAHGAGPLETVRGWILASGSSVDRHEAARRFLTAPAAGAWDDGAAPVVVADRVDTVYAGPIAAGGTTVRIRATRLGILTPTGAFVAQPGPLDLVVGLAELDGQWRISSLPPGTVVRRSDLRANTRPVRTWFVGATSGLPVAETRYLQAAPVRSLPGRALDLLAAGPSDGLAGAAVSALPARATLRAGVGLDPTGALVVDLAGLGPLDELRREQVAGQVVLTLAGIGIARVRLLADGVPLVAGRAELGVGDVLAGLPVGVRERRDLPVDPGSPADPADAPAPAVVATGGRVQTLTDPPSDPVAGAGLVVLSAAPGPQDQLAVVAGGGPGQRLLVGRVGAAPSPTAVAGTTLTRPSWAPTGSEVWTVVDGTHVVRQFRGEEGANPLAQPVDPGGLAAAGPLSALRISPDGARVAAVAGGRVVVGVVVRDPAGGVRVGAAEVLRPGPADAALEGVLDVAWTRSDRIVAVGTQPGHAVQIVSVDGLDLDDAPTVNLTPPVTAVAAGPGLPLLAVDQGGLWSLTDDGSGVWRSVPGGSSGSVPAYSA